MQDGLRIRTLYHVNPKGVWSGQGRIAWSPAHRTDSGKNIHSSVCYLGSLKQIQRVWQMQFVHPCLHRSRLTMCSASILAGTLLNGPKTHLHDLQIDFIGSLHSSTGQEGTSWSFFVPESHRVSCSANSWGVSNLQGGGGNNNQESYGTFKMNKAPENSWHLFSAAHYTVDVYPDVNLHQSCNHQMLKCRTLSSWFSFRKRASNR